VTVCPLRSDFAQSLQPPAALNAAAQAPQWQNLPAVIVFLPAGKLCPLSMWMPSWKCGEKKTPLLCALVPNLTGLQSALSTVGGAVGGATHLIGGGGGGGGGGGLTTSGTMSSGVSICLLLPDGRGYPPSGAWLALAAPSPPQL